MVVSKEKMELKQDDYMTSDHMNANRKKGLTKYDQDLIQKCTFTESRCRPLTGKRKIDMENVYSTVKRPKKSIHIISRGKQNSITNRMRNGKNRNISLKKLTFHPESSKNFDIRHKVILRSMKQKPKVIDEDEDGADMSQVQTFKQPPVKIKVKRKSKSKLKMNSMSCDEFTPPNNNNNEIGECKNGNENNCDNILNLEIDYICEDFLDDMDAHEEEPKILSHPDSCVQKNKPSKNVPKTNQTLKNHSLPYESPSPSGKDVYEFDEDEDETIQPLTRKTVGASSKDSSFTSNPKTDSKAEGTEEKRDFSGRVKLTLKMKKSSVLDDVLAVGNMKVMEPQYEVLRLQVDGPVE